MAATYSWWKTRPPWSGSRGPSSSALRLVDGELSTGGSLRALRRVSTWDATTVARPKSIGSHMIAERIASAPQLIGRLSSERWASAATNLAYAADVSEPALQRQRISSFMQLVLCHWPSVLRIAHAPRPVAGGTQLQIKLPSTVEDYSDDEEEDDEDDQRCRSAR